MSHRVRSLVLLTALGAALASAAVLAAEKPAAKVGRPRNPRRSPRPSTGRLRRGPGGELAKARFAAEALGLQGSRLIRWSASFRRQ